MAVNGGSWLVVFHALLAGETLHALTVCNTDSLATLVCGCAVFPTPPFCVNKGLKKF